MMTSTLKQRKTTSLAANSQAQLRTQALSIHDEHDHTVNLNKTSTQLNRAQATHQPIGRRLSVNNDDFRKPTASLHEKAYTTDHTHDNSFAIAPERKIPIAVKENQFFIDGQSQLLIGTTFQWFRQPESRWDRLLDITQACGFNLIDMYVPWSDIIPQDPFDARTQNTAVDKAMVEKMCRFLEKVQARGMNIYFRPGPYICDEYDGGGIPGYVRAQATKYNPENDPRKLVMRTNNRKWLAYCDHYFSTVLDAARPFLKANGGPIIAIGIENEPDHAEKACVAERYLSVSEGHAERKPVQSPVNRAYYESLMGIIRRYDANIPISLCAGEPHISGTDGTPGLVVLPNNYQLKNFTETTRRMLIDARNPKTYNGIYAEHPTGYTEIPPRSASFLTSALIAGAKLVNYFNGVGYGGAGKNGIIADPTALGVPFSGMSPLSKRKNLFEFSRDRLTTLGLSLPIWYINQYMNCYGPIGALGTLPEKFNAFRRNIMSALAIRPQLATACEPQRTWRPNTYAGQLYDTMANAINWLTGWKSPVTVDHPSLGCKESGGLAHHWNRSPAGSTFLQIMNQTGADQTLTCGSISVDEYNVPKHHPMTIGTEYYPGNPTDQTERDYAITLPFKVPIDNKRNLSYATAGLLANREFNGHRLLVFYGEQGAHGECEIQLAGKSVIPLNIGQGFNIHENNNGNLNLSFQHGDMQRAQFLDEDGKILEIVALNREQAGKTWFQRLDGTQTHGKSLTAPDIMISGVDFLKPIKAMQAREKTSAASSGQLIFNAEYRPRLPAPGVVKSDSTGELNKQSRGLDQAPSAPTGAILSAIPLDVSQGGKLVSATDVTGITRFNLPALSPNPADNGLDASIPLAPTLIEKDDAVPQTLAADRAARAHFGNPLTLDHIGVYEGRAVYQSKINLTAEDIEQNAHLSIAHASGLIGIYINGNYISTLAPLGGEINTKSWHPRYQLVDLKPFLKPGENTISFRCSIWGNGSFGSPCGKIRGLGVQLPAISMEAPRGLYGTATLCGKPLERWWMKAEPIAPPITEKSLGTGTRKQHVVPRPSNPKPVQLTPGSRQWLSVKLDPAQFPQQRGFNAPQVLQISGQNAMVSAYYKGQMIGRVITDDNVLRRGTWTNPSRELWSYTRPDHIPLPIDEMMQGDTTVDLLVEDMSDRREPAGEITQIALALNEEELGFDGEKTVRRPGFMKQTQMEITPRL